MKGNEAIAHAAIRYGIDGYFGYPITPQSEVLETLEAEMPWETTGMVVLQAESEVAAINMVYGGASTGKAVMTSSSSPGVSLKQEGISYLSSMELPAVIVDVMRYGIGLGNVVLGQADYFQATKGGGHGGYKLPVYAPASVQENADFMFKAFDTAEKYRTPVILLSDAAIGQMMGSVELPALIINVMRGGPGLGTIQPSQADYFQATKGGGHGDYHLIVLAPATVQEMADFVGLGMDLAFKYRNPAMILADGVVGQMMEKVVLPEQRPRRTPEQIAEQCPWALTGKHGRDHRNVITSLEMDSVLMEKNNERFQQTYERIRQNEVRFEEHFTEDAEYLIVAFGSIARIALKAIEEARAKGVKVGLLRPITLWPFPEKEIARLSHQVKGILTVELNAGQMIEDVRLAVEGRVPVYHFGRMGGIVPNPGEILEALGKNFPEISK